MGMKRKRVVAEALVISMILGVVPVHAEGVSKNGIVDQTGAVIEVESTEFRGWHWSDGWFYYDENGIMVTGWKWIGQYWYYFAGENEENVGLMAANEMKVINGKTYFFGEGGNMLTGWVKQSEGWYYAAQSGEMMTGWITSGGSWYYLDLDNEEYPGLMVSDCYKEIWGSTYSFDASGRMRTGWYYDNGYRYFDSSGHMVSGWIAENGYWYYLDPQNDNIMFSDGWKEIDGRSFYFYPYGDMATGWTKVDGCWYFLNYYSGKQTGWIAVDGYWYYLNEDGIMLTGWIELGDTWYYLYPYGHMATGWTQVGGYWYYFKGSGAWDPKRSMENTFLGVSRAEIVAELESHRYDSYYLGTRYVPLDWTGNKDACMHPNGSPGAYGYVGMNCTGFVAFVFGKCGGNLKQLDAMGEFGGYVNAISWIDYAKQSGKTYYVYNSVAALLLHGQAQKGDIIYCEPDWSKPGADCHIGIFWGDNSWDNTFWHQVGTNIISNIKAGTPQIRYYLIKTDQ